MGRPEPARAVVLSTILAKERSIYSDKRKREPKRDKSWAKAVGHTLQTDAAVNWAYDHARNWENVAHRTRYSATTGQSYRFGNGAGNTTKEQPAATFLGCCARAGLRSIEEVIYGLTIQKVGMTFELRCPECTRLTGRLGLVRQDGQRIRLHCRVHPENFGEWRSEPEMEVEKLALAGRIGLK